MKPFDEEGLRSLAKTVKGVITAEDHSCIGGLAAAAAFALRGTATSLEYVAIEDSFGQSAHSSQDLMEYYGLTAQTLYEKSMRILG